jgi:hypothetical protein
MGVEILVPLGSFVMIVAIVVAVVWGGVQSRKELNETLRRAIDSGQPLPPEAISALQKPERSPGQDMRSGVILTALAVGFLACSLVFGNGDFGDDGAGRGFAIAAIIVGSIGVGQLIAAWLRRESKP